MRNYSIVNQPSCLQIKRSFLICIKRIMWVLKLPWQRFHNFSDTRCLYIYIYIYHTYSKYSDTLTPYHTCPQFWRSPFYYLFMSKILPYGKQCRPLSDTAECWSGSTLFAEAYIPIPILKVIMVKPVQMSKVTGENCLRRPLIETSALVRQFHFWCKN